MARRWSVVALACVLLSISGMVGAQGAGAVRKQAESTLLVTGTIEIDTQGRLDRLTIDKREALDPAVTAMVETSSKAWRFKPVEIDGKPVRAKAPMTLRLVARKVDADRFGVQIRSATFGSEEGKVGETVKSASMTPPRYPEAAARGGVAGTVYLLVRVGRDGKVEDVLAEQTNLKVVAPEQQMKMLRGLFERTSMIAARKWTFTPPVSGPSAGSAYWVVRVPVDYHFEMSRPKYGAWESYIPGPRAIIPWADREQMLAGADAVSDGALYQLGSGLQLLTPLGPG